MKKRLLSLLLCAAALFALGATAAAAEGTDQETYLTWDGSELVSAPVPASIKEVTHETTTLDGTTNDGWYVVQGDIGITSRITVTGNVHLILANRGMLIAQAGIEVSQGNSLTIYAQTTESNMGFLAADGRDGGAGIGGGEGGKGGTVTINGGKVTATSNSGAGIGGGDYGSEGGSITINGGTVTAESTGTGAGIGGGYDGDGGTITISGGEVKATGGDGAAGIGGGKGGGNGGDGGTITISGGVVEATGEYGGAGIGGGEGSEGGTITISGGEVTATGKSGAGIGGGYHGDGGTIKITGGKVTASSNRTGSGAGIGGGCYGAGGTIEITGGEVTATGSFGAGIGGGVVGAGGTITIGGDAKVTATGDSGAGIGGGGGGDGGKITINGGVVTATGGSGSVGNYGGAGIGGGKGKGGGTIRINSGTVEVAGSGGGADIGGGPDDQGKIVPSELIEISDNAHVTRPDGGKLNIGPTEHEADLAVWSSDGSGHWHPCKKEGCTENHQYDKASHDGAASCTGAGVCSVCGYTIPALGHSYGSLVPEQAATAESEGMKAHYRCGRCGQYFDESRNPTTRDALVIPRTVLYRVTVTTEGKGTASAAPAEAAAGTEIVLTAQPEAGWQFQEWRTDGPEIDGAGRFVLAESDVAVKAVFEEEIPPHVHDWETEWTTSSSHHWHECRAEGCEVTEDSGKDAYGAHTPGEWIVDQEAGPYTAGERHKACTVCGFVTATETIPATGGYEPGGGGSGGGSDSSSGDSVPVTYPPTVERPGLGGSVEVSAERPKKGDTVTVTPKPDEGYEVDRVTVTGPDGKQVEVRKNPDGTFSFVQPGGKVTIEVTYQAVKPVEERRLFTDVGPGDWFYEAVRFVVENGLMNGYDDGRFGPDDRLSRGQLAQILYNKEGRPDGAGEVGFSDVTGGEWFADAVSWAAGAGIVGGYGDGRFGPNDAITREQLAVMLWRYAGSPAAGTELDFRDEEEVSGYAREALSWAVEKGILSGYGDGRLGPQGQATRAQAAQMLMNFMEKG